MSYNDQSHSFDVAQNQFSTKDYVTTPQMADIYAIQSIYGANANTRLGDTTYGFNSNAGALFDFALYNGTPAFTIYDSGGLNDTLDTSGYSTNQIINLNPGQWSSIGVNNNNNIANVNNIGIYLTTIIENAIGGTGNDTITGNGAANILDGGAGNDTLNGGAGVNSLIGGLGNDTFVLSGRHRHGERHWRH